jgi:MoxR-like ATPase
MTDDAAKARIDSLLRNVRRVVVGKTEVVKLHVVALLAEGHVLVEDVPGIGKTLLAKTIAASLGCSFRRLQFTPDMLPSDITGSHIFNQQTSQFEFREGPVFASVLLADEINRATPRTQSALLEAMEERQVSIDGVTMPLPSPFMVIATQNPIELEGTFPLPEAQLDRFLLRTSMGYPEEGEELEIMARFSASNPLADIEPVLNVEAIATLRTQRGRVRAVDDVSRYVLTLVRATRTHPDVQLGASPRAAVALLRACQAWAVLDGRDFINPDDAKQLAEPVLAHRLILSAGARLRGVGTKDVIASVLHNVEVPVEAT